MKLATLFESYDDDTAFNAMLLGKRIKAARFEEWKPKNRVNDPNFEHVTYFRSPLYNEYDVQPGEKVDTWDQFFVYFEIEAYPISATKDKESRYIVEMGTQQPSENYTPLCGPSIRLGSHKDMTRLEKRTTDPLIMLKHVDAMIAAYKKYIVAKFKKVL
jgi:hypothetical protein